MGRSIILTPLMLLSAWCLLICLTPNVHARLYGFDKLEKRGFLAKAGCKLFGTGCSSSESDTDLKYGVLLDAGSSSTKLKVYSVRQDEGAVLPRLDVTYSERFDPGMSTFEGNIDGLRAYLTSIINVAKEKVPESKQEETPIYVLATAGLRFLSADDATELVESTKTALGDPSFSPFLYKPAGIGILSGEEEGVYAWVAANYLLKFFDEKRPDSESVGVLEMGGGSTQITFIPKSPIYDGEFQVSVAGRKYELYVHSYLQFGINAISLWVAEVLSHWYKGRRTVNNPCMLRDDVTDIVLDDGKKLTLTGTGDPTICKIILQEILTPYTGIECEPKPCAIRSVYQPSIEDLQFYATQGFTYAPNTLKVVGEDQVLHLDQLEEAASQHCDQTLAEAVDSGIKESLASTTCLMGLYIPTLFTVSYGFPIDTTDIKVTSNVGNDTIDWSLGAMVIELSGNTVRRRR